MMMMFIAVISGTKHRPTKSSFGNRPDLKLDESVYWSNWSKRLTSWTHLPQFWCERGFKWSFESSYKRNQTVETLKLRDGQPEYLTFQKSQIFERPWANTNPNSGLKLVQIGTLLPGFRSWSFEYACLSAGAPFTLMWSFIIISDVFAELLLFFVCKRIFIFIFSFSRECLRFSPALFQGSCFEDDSLACRDDSQPPLTLNKNVEVYLM